jgi:hypothetical protein
VTVQKQKERMMSRTSRRFPKSEERLLLGPNRGQKAGILIKPVGELQEPLLDNLLIWKLWIIEMNFAQFQFENTPRIFLAGNAFIVTETKKKQPRVVSIPLY